MRDISVIEIDPNSDLEKLFRATDTFVAHMSLELCRSEAEVATAMLCWLEERIDPEAIH